jgi:enoyl-CoA hydratase
VFIRRGLFGGDLGASGWLPRLIGFANAAEMLYTAEPFDAHRAFQIGFVTHIATEGTHVGTAVGIGEKIAPSTARSASARPKTCSTRPLALGNCART